MALPEELRYKEKQFAHSGRIMLEPDDLFRDASWFAVLMGQGHRLSREDSAH
jgi:tryptophan halogenase